MDRRQRLKAAFAGERPDRVPVALWRHWPGDDVRPDTLAAATLKFQNDYNWDFIKVTPSSSYCVEDWGVTTRWVGNMEGTREHLTLPVRSPDDWARLPVLAPEQGSLADHLRCLRLVHDGALDVPFLPTIFSPLAQAKNLAGAEALLSHLRRHPKSFHAGLRTITDSIIRFVRAAKETGAAGIFYAVQHANYGILSEVEYREFGRAYDLQILEEANRATWFNLLHLHGPEPMFALLADYPVQAINWHDRETTPSLRDAFGLTKAALSGGIDRNTTMLQGTPNDVRASVQDAISQTGGRRLIVATGCVTLIPTPTANLRAAREAVQDLSPT